MVTNRELKAETTRKSILDVAQQEILCCGFQACSISEIIRKASISKGCLYHHFASKKELGYAVLDHSIEHMQNEVWAPILISENSLTAIINMLSNHEDFPDNDIIKLGCPINNLSQEMSALDEEFRKKIAIMYTKWKSNLSASLERCQINGHMRTDVNAKEIATLIIAVTQGAAAIAKNSQQAITFGEYSAGLVTYLCSLQLEEKQL
tara:strand:- start:1142 stop:1762 length:621 start_codon:yes stop_codon:yes gene_type:complete